MSALTDAELGIAPSSSDFPDALLPKSYTLDDLMSELGHVEHLLFQATDGLSEQEFGTGKNRNHGLDRISAMVWVARDMVARLNALTEVHYHQIGTTCAPKGAPR